MTYTHRHCSDEMNRQQNTLKIVHTTSVLNRCIRTDTIGYNYCLLNCFLVYLINRTEWFRSIQYNA